MLAAAAQPSSYYFPLGRTQVRGGRAGEKKSACKQIAFCTRSNGFWFLRISRVESFVVKACTPSTTCFIEDSHLDFKYSLQYNCAKNKECDAAGVMHAAFHDDRAVQTDWGLANLWPRLGVGQAPRFEASASCCSFVVDCATLTTLLPKYETSNWLCQVRENQCFIKCGLDSSLPESANSD